MSFDPVNNLAPETALQIFSYLNHSDLAACSQVNTEWNAFTADHSLWQEEDEQLDAKVHSYEDEVEKIKNSAWENVFSKEQNRLYTQAKNQNRIKSIEGADDIESYLFKFETIQPVNMKRDYFDVIGKCCFSPIIRSGNELVERVQSFVNKIPLGKNGRFIVYILECGNEYKTKILLIEIKTNPKHFVTKKTDDLIVKKDTEQKIQFIYSSAINNFEGNIILDDDNEFDHEEVFFSTHNFLQEENFKELPKPASYHSRFTHEDRYSNIGNYDYAVYHGCLHEKNQKTKERTAFQTAFISPFEMARKLKSTIQYNILYSKLVAFEKQTLDQEKKEKKQILQPKLDILADQVISERKQILQLKLDILADQVISERKQILQPKLDILQAKFDILQVEYDNILQAKLQRTMQTMKYMAAASLITTVASYALYFLRQNE